MKSNIDKIPSLVRRLYRVVQELERAFAGRHFTLDGHLVGSLGEVLAAHAYGLQLLPASTAVHDARARDGRLVQIKATQVDRVSLRRCCNVLLVLKLDGRGDFTEVFNGPGRPAWAAAGKVQSNGQRQISVARLLELAAEIPARARLQRIKPATDVAPRGGS